MIAKSTVRHGIFSLLMGVTTLGLGSVALATPFTGVPTADNDGIPDLYDAWNRITGDSFTSNADLEPFRLDPDHDQTFTFNNVHVPVLGFTAGHTNTLGYYTPDDVNSAVFSDTSFSGFGFTGAGSNADPFGYTSFATLPAGAIGFALSSLTGNGTTNIFFSEHGLNGLGNGSTLDHLVAYQVGDRLRSGLFAGFGEIEMKNPILLGFEDIRGGGDSDYDDTIFLVDASPTKIPTPATLLLFGSGLLGSGLLRRKARK